MDNIILEKGFWGKNIEARVEGDTLILSGYGWVKHFKHPNKGKLGDIKNLVIEKGITTVGSYAFSQNRLTSITIPDSVTEIGYEAFSKNQLTSVIIPDSVTEIRAGAFFKNKLTSVIISDSVKIIEDSAFSRNKLALVTIPDSVKVIEAHAFHKNQLTSITIGNSVASIEAFAFLNNQLTSVTFPDSIIKIGYSAFEKNQLTSVTIPDSVTEIGSGAFYDNPLTSVSIPDLLTEIGSEIFGTNPPEITRRKDKEILNDNMNDRILEKGFWGEGISARLEGDTLILSGYGDMKDFDDLIKVLLLDSYRNRLGDIKNLIIEEGITSIGANAFSCNKLTSVIIPDSVTTIGYGAFGNNQLTSVTIPESVTAIGEGAFWENPLKIIQLKNKKILEDDKIRREIKRTMGIETLEETNPSEITFGNKLPQEQRIENLEKEIIQLHAKIKQLENQKGLSKETMDDLLGDL